MTKFKVIEKSRFLKYKELYKVEGGCSCWITRHTICSEQNFKSEPCYTYTTCGILSRYESCNMIGQETTCGGGGPYTNSDFSIHL